MNQNSQFVSIQFNDEQGTSSQEEQFNKQEEEIKKQITIKQNQRKVHSKVIIGSQLHFDMTEFFKFKKRKQKKQGDLANEIFQEVQRGNIVWLILMYLVMNNTDVSPCFLYIDSNRFVRIAWRLFFQNFMLIPFLLYQLRTSTIQIKQQYKISYWLKADNFRKIYLSAFIKTIVLLIILSSYDWSYISHGIILGSLSNFFLSINRYIQNVHHELQPGGQLIIILGILLVLKDALFININTIPSSQWQTINHKYLTRNGLQRTITDIATLSTSYMTALFFRYQAELKSDFPSYLGLFLVNTCLSINMFFSLFFFYGGTFDMNPNYGIFGIYVHSNFTRFGMFISFTMVSRMFSGSLIPSIALLFEPIMSILVLQLTNIQSMPDSSTCIGLVFIILGMFLILIGQWIFQKKQKHEQIEEQNRLTKLLEWRQMRRATRKLNKKNKIQKNTTNKISKIQQSMQKNKPEALRLINEENY